MRAGSVTGLQLGPLSGMLYECLELGLVACGELCVEVAEVGSAGHGHLDGCLSNFFIFLFLFFFINFFLFSLRLVSLVLRYFEVPG